MYAEALRAARVSPSVERRAWNSEPGVDQDGNSGKAPCSSVQVDVMGKLTEKLL